MKTETLFLSSSDLLHELFDVFFVLSESEVSFISDVIFERCNMDKLWHLFQTQNISQSVVHDGHPRSVSKPSDIVVNVIIKNVSSFNVDICFENKSCSAYHHQKIKKTVLTNASYT